MGMGRVDGPQSAERSGKKIGLSTSICTGRRLQEMPCTTWLVALALWRGRTESLSHRAGGLSMVSSTRRNVVSFPWCSEGQRQ